MSFLGKRFLTLREYASLSFGAAQMSDGKFISAIGVIFHSDKNKYYMVDNEQGCVSLMQGSEFTQFLYRGENEFHCPCQSSFVRLKSPEEQIVQICKSYELEQLLETNVAVQKWKAYYENLTGSKMHLGINSEGIAQHYGIKTRLYDFTNNEDIAKFFAYCKCTEMLDGSLKYEPITDESKTAILYTLSVHLAVNSGRLGLIGMQPLLRPCAQNAFSLNQNGFACLNECEFVNREELPIKRSESEKYYEMFDGGEKLFPKETSLERINQLKISKTIHEGVVDLLFSTNDMASFASTMNEAKERLRKFGYEVKDKSNELAYSDDENAKIKTECDVLIGRIQNNVCCRGVSPIKKQL